MVNILVIEDNSMDQEMIKRILDACDLQYKLTIVGDSQLIPLESDRKQVETYDLIILDYNFPEGVSSNLLHLLKTDWNIACPIIVFTGLQYDILKKNVESYNKVFYRHKDDSPMEKLPSFINELLRA